MYKIKFRFDLVPVTNNIIAITFKSIRFKYSCYSRCHRPLVSGRKWNYFFFSHFCSSLLIHFLYFGLYSYASGACSISCLGYGMNIGLVGRIFGREMETERESGRTPKANFPFFPSTNLNHHHIIQPCRENGEEYLPQSIYLT